MRYRTASFGAAECLAFAAAPIFAIMALLSGFFGGGAMEALCGGSALNGMVPMYALMSALHLGPWLKLISGCGRTQSLAGSE